MNRFFTRVLPILFLGLIVSACAAQNQSFVPIGAMPNSLMRASIDVTPDDLDSARTARILSYHLMLLRSKPLARAGGDRRVVYPADLVRKHGPIMKTAASFNIYVNCKSGGESCWGDPEGFQQNLTGSRFAALLTQYTNSPPSDYTFGGSFTVKYRTYTKLFYANDLLAVLHAALVRNENKAGYSNLYHIFLPKGADTCFDRTRSCYSPDHPRTNNFCAYHESVAFKDVAQHVIVSIEPYQKVGFC
ncbi:MAG: hypothetical protein JO104_03180, partial [Candidatus Eremiobacteraeota bacterium]|nr:hypothetical protein [Candidatus Eremiobacteraeota bacterium]